MRIFEQAASELGYELGDRVFKRQVLENRINIGGSNYFQFGDLGVETQTHHVVVEVESAGGVTNLVKYWYSLEKQYISKPVVLFHIFRQSSKADYASHLKLWDFLWSKMKVALHGRMEATRYTYRDLEDKDLELAVNEFKKYLASADIVEAAAPLIEMAITEDIGPGDATSEAVLPAELELYGRIVAKSAGVVAGLPVAEAVFSRVDPALRFISHVQDGDRVGPGDLVAEVTGPGRGMLAAERIALNFLQRLSGIATLTRAFVDAVAGTGATILDTRKTHPGYRLLEKYAARMGGGQNHRMSLHDMMMVKDNHIDAAGGITAAVERARVGYPDLPIEVEVRNLDELRESLALNLDRIMLDNMSLDEMREAVRITAGRVALEASGNVNLETVAAIAATGVDYISVGALTHSAPALDLSMLVGR